MMSIARAMAEQWEQKEKMTRKEAVEAIKANYPPKHYSILCEALDMAIEVLEATAWIPCNERMPDEYEWMGTKRFGTTLSKRVLVTVVDKAVVKGDKEQYDGDRVVVCESFQNGRARVFSGDPVAWMPLPGPYREE